MAKLQGLYHKDKSHLIAINSDVHLVISKRNTSSIQKPIEYLLLKKGKSHEYISSMYPTSNPNKYQIDYSGSRYHVEFINSDMVKIS